MSDVAGGSQRETEAMEFTRPPAGRTVAFVASSPDSSGRLAGDGPPEVLGESHIQLRVTDLDRSARFYTEIVGFREHHRSDWQVILTCGTWNMGLVAAVHWQRYNPPQEPFDVGRAGLQHLAFALGSTAAVDASAAWLDKNGVRRKRVMDGLTQGSRYVTFYDPDGIPLEFYYLDAVNAAAYGLDLEPPK